MIDWFKFIKQYRPGPITIKGFLHDFLIGISGDPTEIKDSLTHDENFSAMDLHSFFCFDSEPG